MDAGAAAAAAEAAVGEAADAFGAAAEAATGAARPGAAGVCEVVPGAADDADAGADTEPTAGMGAVASRTLRADTKGVLVAEDAAEVDAEAEALAALLLLPPALLTPSFFSVTAAPSAAMICVSFAAIRSICMATLWHVGQGSATGADGTGAGTGVAGCTGSVWVWACACDAREEGVSTAEGVDAASGAVSTAKDAGATGASAGAATGKDANGAVAE